MDWDSIVLLVLISIGLLTSIIILCSLIYSNHILGLSDHVKPAVLTITYCSIILFIICLGSNLMNFEIIEDLSFVSLIVWNDIAVLSWNFAQILVFTLLMLRVYYTFHDTVYKVSIWVYICFAILLFLYIICCCVWYIHNLIVLKAHYKNKASLFKVYRYLNSGYIIAVEVIDLLISILLITLFIRQMIKVTVALRDDLNPIILTKQSEATLTLSAQSIDIQNRSSIQLNPNQTDMINSVTRYSVLSIIALLSTQLNVLFFCVESITYNLYPGDWEIWGSYFAGIFFCIDCIINSICLYLLFGINKKIYHMLCNKCHLCFAWCLIKVTQKRVKKKYWKASQAQMNMQFV